MDKTADLTSGVNGTKKMSVAKQHALPISGMAQTFVVANATVCFKTDSLAGFSVTITYSSKGRKSPMAEQ